MRRRFTLTACTAVALAVGTLFGGFGFDRTTEAQAQDSTLVMGTSPDYPPYEFYDTSSGQEVIVGFDIDIANRIAEELGVELEIMGMDFNGLIPALQSERVDFVMAGMTPTEERLENVDFSDVYFQANNTIISQRGSSISTVEDLSDKIVGVQLGSIQEDEATDLAEADETITLKPLNKLGEIIQEIKSGRLDAAIIEDTVAQGFAASNPDLQFSVIPTDGPSGSAIAFPKGSDLVVQFNDILSEMEESGEIEELAIKWFGEAPDAE